MNRGKILRVRRVWEGRENLKGLKDGSRGCPQPIVAIIPLW
jgi:hypothetical protein